MFSDTPWYWLVVGFAGQGLFTGRFLVQWIVSEREGKSMVPIAFWWLSLFGGGTLLAYALYQRDPVIVLGQATGLVVYSRNLALIGRKKAREAEPDQQTVPAPHFAQAEGARV